MFTQHSPDDDKDAPGTGDPHEDADQDLRTEVSQLRRAMQTRPTIDLARGMLMATFGLSPQAAWSVLVTTSQNTNTKLHRLADDLVETVQGAPLPKAVHQQLVKAVAEANAATAAEGSGRRPTASRQAPAAGPRHSAAGPSHDLGHGPSHDPGSGPSQESRPGPRSPAGP
ncbi:ANTAR domain-containing protein [Streptomyces albus]|uniref:ANTAR domain-containing protein n=1 Tax=Streptomyces albus TaxID=1888 RepID=UPI0006E2D289|nr:ANTAR domain-containing protein [Streptomyces albus]